VVRFLRVAAVTSLALLAVDSEVAAFNDRATDLLPGCRGVVVASTKFHSATEALTEGTCFGIVVGITFADNRICTPSPGSTYEQAIRVVIDYVDKRPARLNEDFTVLAQEALRAAWPCQR
jgi:hypothetical protein